MRAIALFLVTLGLAACGSSAKPVQLLDLEGLSVSPLLEIDAKARVFVFVRIDCPIANRYMPELERIAAQFKPQEVEFQLVFCEREENADAIRTHLRAYDSSIGALQDPHHALVEFSGVHVTPEAAVYAADGELVYRGRVDDRHVDFGQARAEPTRRDLVLALEEFLAGEPVSVPRTEAVGCYIGATE